MSVTRVRTVLIVALVVLLALAGVPLLTPGMMCHECGPAVVHALASCPFVLPEAITLAAVAGLVFLLTGERRRWLDRFGLAPPHRPPRLI